MAYSTPPPKPRRARAARLPGIRARDDQYIAVNALTKLRIAERILADTLLPLDSPDDVEELRRVSLRACADMVAHLEHRMGVRE